MKRLLLPLLAALALPTASNAETWWLMADGRYNTLLSHLGLFLFILKNNVKKQVKNLWIKNRIKKSYQIV